MLTDAKKVIASQKKELRFTGKSIILRSYAKVRVDHIG